MLKQFLFITTFLCLIVNAQAQEVQSDSLGDPVMINGESFYLHAIEKGNTLYSISKKYGIAINDLKAANEEIWNGMRIGDTLKIPVKAIEILKEDQEHSDGNYIIHEVGRKNTLYSIAKEYNVDIQDILAANPDVEEGGLKKGMKLKIPVAKIKSDEPSMDEYVDPTAASPYLTHRVMPKETLYSLSKAYNVSIDSIKAVNNGLPEGLKVDQLINLPILKKYKDTIVGGAKFDSTAFKESYTISLLLPFYLDELDRAMDTSGRTSERIYQKLYARSQYAIDFYNGFKLAADSITKQGLNLKLKVYDTANDTAKLKKMIKDSSFVGTDLFVGPLYFDEFVIMADYAKQKRVNIVSPVKQSNKILLGNAYVSKVISSDPVLLNFLGKYLADTLSESNLLMVYPDHMKERSMAEMIQKSYREAVDVDYMFEDTTSKVHSVLKEMMWDPKESDIEQKLDSTKENIVVVPSNNQPFVTQIMTKLRMLEDYDVTVIGLEDWEGFDNIDVEYLHLLNVHLVSTERLDYESPSIKRFCKMYKKSYELPAEEFSILGYDVGMYYMSLMNDYGLNFEPMFLDYQDEFLSRKFDFFKTGLESGFENHSVYLLKYENYKLVRVH
ncbi:MAG: hypothetical protein CMP59_06330 [Flavobacteriales bacterium]|nr:hypothetical protein [Flavobacteriales bacterium]